MIDKTELRKNIPIIVMSRRRYAWAISCDIDSDRKVNHVYNLIYKLRYYFYSAQDQYNFAKISNGHSHPDGDESNLNHDDYHEKQASKFHMHMIGKPIEFSREIINTCEAFLILYLFGVTIQFIVFASRKTNSRSNWRLLR